MNKVYSFSEPFGSLWTYWYVRESSTALLVANLPYVWTFWRRIATGTGSVDGMSRQASATPEDALSRGEKEMKRKDTTRRRPSSPWHMYGLGADSADELEMGQPGKRRGAGGMTLDEMLRESTTDLVAGEEISPVTHPGLFYSREARRKNGSDAQLQRAVVSDSGARDLLRPDSSSGHLHQQEDTPVSSVFPQSLNSRKSAGSFL